MALKFKLIGLLLAAMALTNTALGLMCHGDRRVEFVFHYREAP